MEILNEILYRPLFNALIFLYNTIGFHDLGMAIIILTIIIRALLWPSQAKALRSQRDLQRLQPELEKIRTKHKDKQKQTQETLEFYRKHKISPFSSCLPMLIQLPIIIALYQVFRHSLVKESLSALYPFISRPETINSISLGIIDLSQPNRLVLPILTGGLQFVQSWMMMKRTGAAKNQKLDAASAISKQMLYIFPLMTIFIAMSLPAALPIYWIVTTLFAIVQQWYIMREMKGNKGKISSRGIKIRIKKRGR
jgi:YidC/Oxa1 family membrane protein insertase